MLIIAEQGGVVDDKALINALKQGRLDGATLDAHEIGPMTKESGK